MMLLCARMRLSEQSEEWQSPEIHKRHAVPDRLTISPFLGEVQQRFSGVEKNSRIENWHGSRKITA